MDSVGRKRKVKTKQKLAQNNKETLCRRQRRPKVELLVRRCNCDPLKRRPTYQVFPRSAGNCPKLHLAAWLALCSLCLIAAEQPSFPKAQANQSLSAIIAGDLRPSGANATGCLPFIGALLGIGGQCEPQTETTTTAAASSSSSPAMRYESLKVNQSATPPMTTTTSETQQWSSSGSKSSSSSGGQQVEKAARGELSNATSNSNNATSSSSSKPQLQQQRALSNLNVLCNSRCNCVILDLSSPQQQQQQQQAARQLVTPDTIKPSSSAASMATSRDDGSSGAPGSGSSGASSSADADQANQALIAFNEDYSLDYEQPQAEQQPQQILLAGSNPSSAQTNAIEQSTRQPQLQPQESDKQQQQQLPTSSSNGNNNLQLFPLQHHLQAGSSKASSPQLYAQSLYSSQAPKLSYHAHAPYLKQLAGSSSSSLQAAAASPYLSHSPQSSSSPSSPPSVYSAEGAASSPGGIQTNYHHHLHHNMRSNYHLSSRHPHSTSFQTSGKGGAKPAQEGPEPASANEQFTRVKVRGLIPLRTLNASDSHDIKQTEALSSIIVDSHNSLDLKVADGLLNGLESLLTRIEQENVQSLILSRNDIEFEYWTELYALLAASFRRHLYHLDLSHNSIVKLGITFTGYLEHHLAAHDGIWLQQQQQQQQQQSNPNLSPQTNTTNSGQNDISASTGQRQKKSPTNPTRVNSLLNGGKLYSIMQTRLSNRTHLVLTSAVNKTSASNHKQLLVQPILIRALDLSHNKLKWLINDQFKALKHVQTIRLDHNRIRYIHQHAFSGLESLRFLNLNYNRLQVIYIEQFQTNYNLLALMLRSNYLAYLRGGSFASLSQLKRLDLSQNKLTILSNNAFIGLESLELLNCSSNQFAHVPSGSFHPLTSLKKLDLSNNLVTELAPGTFFHMPVEELWLNQNDQLVTIERGALWDLPYLSRLHLGSNPMLTSINSQSFVSTQNLKFIDIDDCQSLDANARQLLENITMTATSRQLRLEQQSSAPTTTTAAAAATTVSSSTSVPPSSAIMTAPLEPVKGSNGNLTGMTTGEAPSPQLQLQLQPRKTSNTWLAKQQQQLLPPPQSKNISNLTILYYTGTIALLFVALALVFKYTSTSHYMDSLRRRRRVYELDLTTGQQQQTNRKYSISSGYSAGQIGSSQSECDSVFVATSDDDQSSTSSRHLAAGAQFELYESTNNVIFQHHSPQSLGGADHHDGCQQEELDISVINVSPSANPSTLCCPDCDGAQLLHVAVATGAPPGEMDAAATVASVSGGGGECCPHQSGGASGEVAQSPRPLEADQQQPAQSPSIDLIHSQLIAAGFDYGHSNCAHFYQSLGPALQLADMTANFVNNMDFY